MLPLIFGDMWMAENFQFWTFRWVLVFPLHDWDKVLDGVAKDTRGGGLLGGRVRLVLVLQDSHLEPVQVEAAVRASVPRDKALDGLDAYLRPTITVSGVVESVEVTYEQSSQTLICTSRGGPATSVTWSLNNSLILVDGNTYQTSQIITTTR